jgi:hypothetical protein
MKRPKKRERLGAVGVSVRILMLLLPPSFWANIAFPREKGNPVGGQRAHWSRFIAMENTMPHHKEEVGGMGTDSVFHGP